MIGIESNAVLCNILLLYQYLYNNIQKNRRLYQYKAYLSTSLKDGSSSAEELYRRFIILSFHLGELILYTPPLLTLYLSIQTKQY